MEEESPDIILGYFEETSNHQNLASNQPYDYSNILPPQRNYNPNKTNKKKKMKKKKNIHG